ncbi:hypothetical protein TIFTF001_044638 [Ficus carica]|uniref:Uncharacterized protein n=1 Tax=Ficus carica TaxID=3494 RepID=A0AA88DAJ9_FICCA|nr:hypothetical protein TIFTF001_044638 [Ficus carica]
MHCLIVMASLVSLPKGIEHFPSNYHEVYCNGVCYWYYWISREEAMISFDVCDKVFQAPGLVDVWVMEDSSGVGGSCCWIKCLTIAPIQGVESPVAFWGQ